MDFYLLWLYLGAWLAWYLLANGMEWLFWRRKYPSLDSTPYMTLSNQLANLLHAALVIPLGFVVFLFEYEAELVPLSEWQRQILSFSLAFFLVDTLTLLICRSKKWDAYLHHLIVIGIYWYIFAANNSGWWTVTILAIAELGPCIYLEHCARISGYQNPKFFKINDTFYLASFLFSRLVLITLVLVFAMSYPGPFAAKILSLAIWLVGLYWCVLLSRRYRRRYPTSRLTRHILHPLASIV